MSKDTFGDWLRDGRTVYELTDRRVNRWSALVQDAHTPEAELVEIARLIAAAPRMFARIERLASKGDAEAISIMEAVNGHA